MRRAVLGDEHVDSVNSKTTAIDEPFQDYITSAVWSDIWARQGLDVLTRRYLTIGLLTALGAERELELHIRAALHADVDPDTLREVMSQTAQIIGIQSIRSSSTLLDRILAETT